MSAIAKFLDYPELTPYITDMRLQVGSIPWVNINHHWMPHPCIQQPITHADLEVFVQETQTINDEQDLLVKGRELDFAFSAQVGDKGVVHRFRGHESKNYQGMAIDVRVLRAQCISFQDLGFKQGLVEKLIENKTGLILIGGATGSGKSTTLASLVHSFGTQFPGSHIVSLEDPVEYIFNPPDCLVSQKHVPVHVDTFERGIFEAKREKPDLIVIGELRTKEACRAALEAAGSGHLVIATTFADRIPRVLDSIKDAFSPEEGESVQRRLSYLLRGVICQALAPSKQTNEKGYALPSLVYEALCNDEPGVLASIKNGTWGEFNMESEGLSGFSVSWYARVKELESSQQIEPSVAEFLRKK